MSDNPAQKRRTRFHARIAIEREMLAIVNSSKACINVPLAGMTRQAIEEWETRAKSQLANGLAANVANLLLEIGRRSELLADESRDVFKPNQLIDSGDLDQAKVQLKKLLAA